MRLSGAAVPARPAPLRLAGVRRVQRRRAQAPTLQADKAAEAATAEAGSAAPAQPGGEDGLSCIGTGMEVECRLPDGEPSTSGRPPESGGAGGGGAAAPGARGRAAHLCTLQSTRALPPARRAAAAAPLSLGDVLLLISPFFFWGTSMVAMKELGPHTTPLALAAWRLLPAGVVLLAWAWQDGRKQPQGATAWLAVSLFGLVDGACFQVRRRLLGWRQRPQAPPHPGGACRGV